MNSAIIVYLDSFTKFRRTAVNKTVHADYADSSFIFPMRRTTIRYLKSNTAAIFRLVKMISKRAAQTKTLPAETLLLNKPGINAVVTGILEKGTSVVIRGSINDYYYISGNGNEGWILK
jgi:hypothetical protein